LYCLRKIMIIDYYKQKLKIKYKYIKGLMSSTFGPSIKNLNKSKKYAFIFCAADYNNLGDIAITYAQEMFLKDTLGKEYSIIKISACEVYLWVKAIKKLSPKNVLVTFIGGGNNGSLYEFIEEPRRYVYKHLRKYNIVSFPQTVVFEETAKAIPYKKEFIKLCNKCKNLHLFAREEYSYKEYQKMVKKNAWLCPDIVFSLKRNKEIERENILAVIMRNDKEKLLDVSLQEELIGYLKERFPEVEYMDTCNVNLSNDLTQELENYLHKLSSCKLAITDRLHGMIFCYITKTPCIVIGINNPKIESTYNTWMKNQNYIRFWDINDVKDKFLEIVKELKDLREIESEDLSLYYNSLKETVRKEPIYAED